MILVILASNVLGSLCHFIPISLEQLGNKLPRRSGVDTDEKDDEDVDCRCLNRSKPENPVHESDPDPGQKQASNNYPQHQHSIYLRFSFLPYIVHWLCQDEYFLTI